MIVMILAVGLAGCAGQSERHVQFFKAYGPGQVAGQPRRRRRLVGLGHRYDVHPPGSAARNKRVRALLHGKGVTDGLTDLASKGR